MGQVRAEMARGSDPGSPEVQALARRWQALVDEFTGGDPGIENSLKRLWQEQGPKLAEQHGMSFDPQMGQFIRQALAIQKGSA